MKTEKPNWPYHMEAIPNWPYHMALNTPLFFDPYGEQSTNDPWNVRIAREKKALQYDIEYANMPMKASLTSSTYCKT